MQVRSACASASPDWALAGVKDTVMPATASVPRAMTIMF